MASAGIMRHVKAIRMASARSINTSTCLRPLRMANLQSKGSNQPTLRTIQAGLATQGSRAALLHTTSPYEQDAKKVFITIQTEKETVTLAGVEGKSLLDLIVDSNYEIDGFAVCDGTIACSTCHTILSKKDFEKDNDTISLDELDLLDTTSDVTETSRLGCQVYIKRWMDGMKVFVPLSKDLRDESF